MAMTAEDRKKRIRLRSWRRGMKEMDLILGGFADRQLAALTDQDLDLYELLLEEMDQDLYDWASGRAETPERYQQLMDKIRTNGR